MDLVKTLKSSSTTMRRCRLPVDARTFWLWLASTSRRQRRSQRRRSCCCCCCFATIVSGVSFLKNCSEMLGKGLCGECVHNTYVFIYVCVCVCMCLWNTVRRHVCMCACCCCCACICFVRFSCCQFLPNTQGRDNFQRVRCDVNVLARSCCCCFCSLTRTVSRCEIFRISLLIQQIRNHYTVLQYVRQFVPPSSSSRWHSLGNGSRSSARRRNCEWKFWMKFILTFSTLYFPLPVIEIHWRKGLRVLPITNYHQYAFGYINKLQ